ncbi:MAG: hypothetical protein EOP02_38120 [Proteobacteria bacterium]|nr:MAG: hypothetical protein EOP02_38120 [Pseudomonadota bacterium]
MKEQVPFINLEVKWKGNQSGVESSVLCCEGDLVIADASEDRQDVGKAIELVRLNGEKVVAGLHTIWARPDLSIMHVGFGAYLMQSAELKQQMANAAQTSPGRERVNG